MSEGNPKMKKNEYDDTFVVYESGVKDPSWIGLVSEPDKAGWRAVDIAFLAKQTSEHDRVRLNEISILLYDHGLKKNNNRIPKEWQWEVVKYPMDQKHYRTYVRNTLEEE